MKVSRTLTTVLPLGAVLAACGTDERRLLNGDPSWESAQNQSTAFRVSSLELVDPSPFVRVRVLFFTLCVDGRGEVNNSITSNLQTDADNPPDGLLDLSILQTFTPFDPNAVSAPTEVFAADCTVPAMGAETSCTRSAVEPVFLGEAFNQGVDVCFTADPNNLTAERAGQLNPTNGPCYRSDLGTISLQLGGIPLSFEDTTISATYAGTPEQPQLQGLISGFVSEDNARNTILPPNLDRVGGLPLYDVLRGGGACGNVVSSDVDVGPDGITSGWYFYLNFTADEVPFTVVP